MSEQAPVPDRSKELTDMALDWAASTLPRQVALILTPILLPVLGGLAFWLQDKFGIDMDPAEATGFVVSVVLGVGAVILTWVHNHGRGASRLTQAALELEKLYEAGKQELAASGVSDTTTPSSTQGNDPSVPPGLRRG